MLIRNKTLSNIEIPDLGITVIVDIDFDLSNTPSSDVTDSINLRSFIADGSLVALGADTDGNPTVELPPDSIEVSQSLTDGHTHPEYATTKEVEQKISDLVSGAPEQLDTLSELATQLADDSNALSAINNALADKAPKEHSHQDLIDALALKAADADVDTLADMIGEKADSTVTDGHASRIDEIESKGATKNDVAENALAIGTLSETKANKSAITDLITIVNKKAENVDLNGAFSEIQVLKDDKADKVHDHDDLASKDELDAKADSDHGHDSKYHNRTYLDSVINDIKTGKADKQFVDSELAKKASVGHLHDTYYTRIEVDEILGEMPGGNSGPPVITLTEDAEISFNATYIIENKTDVPLKLTLPAFNEDSDHSNTKGQSLFILARYGRFDIYSNDNMLAQRIIRKGGISETGSKNNSVKLAKAVSDFAYCRLMILNESGADMLMIDWGMTLNSYVMPVSQKDRIIHFSCEDGSVLGNQIMDQSGHSNNGFMSNITQTEDGFIGEKALYANDRNKPSITVADSKSMKTQTLGIFCKFKFEEINSTRCLFSKKNAFHWVLKNGRPEIYLKTWNGSIYAYNSGLYLNANQYYQGGMTYDGESLKVFLNGVKIFDIFKWSSFRNDSTDPLYLFFKYSLRNYMSGTIDDFVWFDSAPSEEEAIAITSQPQTIQQALKVFDFDPTMLTGDTVLDQSGNDVNGEKSGITVDYGLFHPREALSVQKMSFDDSESIIPACGELTPVPGVVDGAKRFNKAQINIENAGLNTRQDEFITIKFWAPRNFFSGYEMICTSNKCAVAFAGNMIGLNTYNSDIVGSNIADISNDGQMHQYIIELCNGSVKSTKVYVDTICRETTHEGGRYDDTVAYLGGDNGRIMIGASNQNYFYNNVLDQFEIFNGRLTQDEKDLIFKEESLGHQWENTYLHDAGFVLNESDSQITIPFNEKMNSMESAGGLGFIFEMTDEGGITNISKASYGIVCRENCWSIVIFNGKIMFMNENNDYGTTLVSDSIIEHGKEYDVCINLRGDEIRMAINGIMQSQKIKMDSFKTNTNNIHIGSCADYIAAKGMHIRAMRMYYSARTDKQMIQNTMP